MKIWEKIEAIWEKWLAKLADNNRRQFGSQKADCCNLLNSKSKGGNHEVS